MVERDMDAVSKLLDQYEIQGPRNWDEVDVGFVLCENSEVVGFIHGFK